jgi:hypothetical protein
MQHNVTVDTIGGLFNMEHDGDHEELRPSAALTEEAIPTIHTG